MKMFTRAVVADPEDVDTLVRGQTTVHIRLAVSADRDGLRAFNRRCSDHSLYLRYFAVSRYAADGDLDRVLRPPGRAHGALVGEADGAIVGLAAFEGITGEDAEVAIIIDDEHQKLGVGTLLLDDLVAAVRRAGYTRVIAEVLAENHVMLEVFDRLGIVERRASRGGVVELMCQLGGLQF